MDKKEQKQILQDIADILVTMEPTVEIEKIKYKLSSLMACYEVESERMNNYYEYYLLGFYEDELFTKSFYCVDAMKMLEEICYKMCFADIEIFKVIYKGRELRWTKRGTTVIFKDRKTKEIICVLEGKENVGA